MPDWVTASNALFVFIATAFAVLVAAWVRVEFRTVKGDVVTNGILSDLDEKTKTTAACVLEVKTEIDKAKINLKTEFPVNGARPL